IEFEITFPDCSCCHALTLNTSVSAVRTWAIDFKLRRELHAKRTERSITRETPVLRLIYVRVTACRTDLSPRLKPPRKIPIHFCHDVCLLSISSSTLQAAEQSAKSQGPRAKS